MNDNLPVLSQRSELTEVGRDNLIREFKKLAKTSFGRSGRHFWEEFVDGLVKGECPSIDLSRSYRRVPNIQALREDIHKLVFPGSDMSKVTEDLIKVYDAIILTVMKGVG